MFWHHKPDNLHTRTHTHSFTIHEKHLQNSEFHYRITFYPVNTTGFQQRGSRFLMYSSGIGCRDVGRPSIVSRRRHSLVQHGMSITEQVIKSRSSLFPAKLYIAPVLIDNEKDVRFKSALSHNSFILTNPRVWWYIDGIGSPFGIIEMF